MKTIATDYYELLEVSPHASSEVIVQAWRVLALRYHPDRAPERMRELSNERMKMLNEAKAVLLSQPDRLAYDLLRKTRMTSPAAPKTVPTAATSPPVAATPSPTQAAEDRLWEPWRQIPAFFGVVWLVAKTLAMFLVGGAIAYLALTLGGYALFTVLWVIGIVAPAIGH